MRCSRLCAVWLALVWLCFQSSAHAQDSVDQETYLRIANEAFEQLVAGELRDVNDLIKKHEQLVGLGVAFCRQYANIYPEHAKFLQLVVDSAPDMVRMTQEEIIRNWYRGELPKQHGVDPRGKDHFEEMSNLMDLVVHPSYVIILLKMYQEKPDKALIKRMKIELGELITHAETLFKK
ncbi:MAG: hypothetical protein AB1810_14725 [Pseudomonadota bacterium]